MDEIQYLENLALEMNHDYSISLYGSVLGIAVEENFITRGWRMFVQWIKDAISTIQRWWINHFRKDQRDIIRNRALETYLIQANSETDSRLRRVNSSYPLKVLQDRLNEGAPEWITVVDDLIDMWENTRTNMFRELILHSNDKFYKKIPVPESVTKSTEILNELVNSRNDSDSQVDPRISKITSSIIKINALKMDCYKMTQLINKEQYLGTVDATVTGGRF